MDHVARIVVAQFHVVFLFRVLFHVVYDFFLVFGLDHEPVSLAAFYLVGHRRY